MITGPMVLMEAYKYQPLAHASDIRLLRLHAATQLGDPIQISIERHERLPAVARSRFGLDAAYRDARTEFERARNDLEADKTLQHCVKRDPVRSDTDAHHADLSEARSQVQIRYKVAKTEFEEQSAKYWARRQEEASAPDAPPLWSLSYEALSYAWGTDPTTDTISVLQAGSARSLEVRRNVAEMLRNLRRPRSDRQLWIDSIAINQADLLEKESQVKQMGVIYADASRVLIWLGPESDSEESVQNENDDNITQSALEPSIELIKRSWFHRRWVIQEVGLASEAIMVCGTKSIEFQEFVCRIERLQRLSETSSVAFIPTDKTVIERLRAMANLQLSCRGQFLPRRLLDLLLNFAAAKCSDDRDILYALNSLSMSPLSISYRVPTEDLYMSFAYSEVMQTPSILLSVAGAHPTSSKSLPSWTPDWRVTPIYEPYTNRNFDSAYRAKIKWNQIIMLDQMILTVMGKQMGKVALASTFHNLENWVKLYVSHSNELPHSENLSALDLLKVLTRSRGGLHRLSSNQHGILLKFLTRDPTINGRPAKFVQRFFGEIDEIMRGRTCFITDSGAIGMGPARIRVGDVLIQIPDSPGVTALRPVRVSSSIPSKYTSGPEPGLGNALVNVLRPSDGGSASAKYIVVGDCHVPRLVRGHIQPTLALEDLSPFNIV
jgi:hypothetical protein